MVSLDIFSCDQETEWMSALRKARRCSVYHLPTYHALARRHGEGEPKLFVYREGTIQLAIPLILRHIQVEQQDTEAAQRLDATSAYGYVGPVQSHQRIPPEAIRDFQSSLQACYRELRIVSVFSRLNPLIGQTHLLAGLGECPIVGDTVSIDLARHPDEIWKAYRENHRRDIERSRRAGMECLRDTELAYLDEFCDIYSETMHRVGARSEFYHDRSYFVELLHAWRGYAHLFVALLEGRPICGGIFTICGDVAEYHFGGARDDALRLSPLKTLLDAVRRWATSEGARTFQLGGAPGGPDDPLIGFKLGFGGTRDVQRVWKWIVEPEIYARLTQLAHGAAAGSNLARFDSYFPAYRRRV